jgi:hypothetical protein
MEDYDDGGSSKVEGFHPSNQQLMRLLGLDSRNQLGHLAFLLNQQWVWKIWLI